MSCGSETAEVAAANAAINQANASFDANINAIAVYGTVMSASCAGAAGGAVPLIGPCVMAGAATANAIKGANDAIDALKAAYGRQIQAEQALWECEARKRVAGT